MATKDIALKNYLSISEVFADLFNGALFDGKQVLEADKLETVDSSTTVLVKDGDETKPIQRYRDVIKKVCMGKEFVILGTEAQMNVHYGMPVRNLLYDALNYTEQVGEISRRHKKEGDLVGDEFLSGLSKEDRLIPTITLVVYYGLEEWDGCMDMYGLLGMDEKDELLKGYIPNYKMNFLWACGVEHPERFQTGLRELFGVLKNQESGNELEDYVQNNRERFYNLDDETFQVIGVVTGTEREITEQKERFRNEKGGVDMIQAMLDIKNEGENKMVKLVKRLQEDGRMDDLSKSLEDEEYRMELYREYGID